ncbi:hypothetical protein Bca4012_103214 [Brassica carinata]
MDSNNNRTLSIPVTLKGVNYLLWARMVKIALGGKGLWSHVSTEAAPKQTIQGEDAKEMVVADEDKWGQEDLMVLTALLSSLEPAIMESYSYCETTKQLWDTLYKVYGNVSNLTRVFEVKRAINALSQGDEEFQPHFGKYRSLWAELELLRPHTNDPATLSTRREEDKVFGLLLTLNPSYGSLVKHILRADRLPDLDEVCAQIQKEEGSVGLFGSKGDLTMAHQAEEVVANKAAYKQDEKKVLICDHCKKKGHMKDKCWILHPHIKPNKFKEPRFQDARAHLSTDGTKPVTPSSMCSNNNEPEKVRKEPTQAVEEAVEDVEVPHPDHEGGNGNDEQSAPAQPEDNSVVHDQDEIQPESDTEIQVEQIQPLRRSTRIRRPASNWINTRVYFNAEAVAHPTSAVCSLAHYPEEHQAFISELDQEYIPRTYEEAMQHEEWRASVGDEMGAMVKNDTWFETALPKGKKAVTSRLSYTIKYGANGKPERKKTRLVARGYTQVYGEEYLDTFAPVAKLHTIRILLSLAVNLEWDLWQMDVKNAFLQGELEDEVYMRPPPGLEYMVKPGNVLRLKKAIYGLKQSPRACASVKVLRSDNGGEYISNAFKSHLAKHGIVHQTSCPYTPQQNGVAERKNRHLMEVARSMMFHTNVPKRFWSYAVQTACYLINRVPTKILKNLSPFEVLNKSRPFIDHLRFFGCVCYVMVPGEQRNKLEAKSTKAMFIGYSITQKGYKLLE